MSTSVVASTAEPRSVAPRENRNGALLAFVAAALVVLPLVVAVVSLVGYKWHPASDVGVEVLRIKDVGGTHTPLVGVSSRFGYFHPGPLLFWTLAPFDWLFGTTGILIGTVFVNGAAAIGALAVAWRRGRAPLTVLVALVVVLIARASGPELLVEPWNPWIVVLPFLLFSLLAWSLAERDWPALPWLVGVGSFVVQGHVGYAPAVLGLGAVAGTIAVLRVRHDAARGAPGYDAALDGTPRRRWLLVAGCVGVLCWLAPVVQQLTGSSGNLADLVDTFRHPREAVAGWEAAFGIMGRQLAPIPAFVTGDETDSTGLLARTSALPAIVLLLSASVVGWLAWRRGARSAGHLALLAVTAGVVGVVAASRITGITAPYLARWAWVIAALIWLSVIWSFSAVIADARVLRGVVIAAVVVTVALSLSTAWRAVGVRPPGDQLSKAIASIGAQASARLDPHREYLVTWLDEDAAGATGIGTFVELEGRGERVRVVRRLRRPFGTWRTARDRDVDGILTVVSGYDLDAGWAPPPGSQQIATYDPLTPSERARARRLDQRVRSMLSRNVRAGPLPIVLASDRDQLVARGADRALVEELGRLRREGDRYFIFLAPA